MALDIKDFFQATNPGKVLFLENSSEDRKYYIDFSSVRGGKIIDDLRDNITVLSPEQPTCELFTGHVGCGKSTELLRLKIELEKADFHVVYFESNEYLELGDIDVNDILLVIAGQVSESLKALNLKEPKKLQSLFKGVYDLLQTEIDITGVSFSVPGVGEVKGNNEGEFSVKMGIAEISALAQARPQLRKKLKDYLEPRTNATIDAINQEIIEPGIEKLKFNGKKGLVVIVDNLDRIERNQTSWGQPQSEYLFLERGEQLRRLKCHLLYTFPLALMFSNNYELLTQRLLTTPNVLPMVTVKHRDGTQCEEGLALLRQMVLARAFPNLSEQERLDKITEVFENSETLDRLCLVSGGHIRNLLRFLYDCIRKQKKLPLSRQTLEEIIQVRQNQMLKAVEEDEWKLLRQVSQQKKVTGDNEYKVLIQSMFVYEYSDAQGSWFEINPILNDVEELK